MNRLEDFFYNQPHRICQKWKHYFPIYERFFSKFQNKPDFKILEIGVSQGGSLDMWRNYFGDQALIVGIDVTEHCKTFETGNTKVRIGSQQDPEFLKSVIDEFGDFDVILDDGGHMMEQQITSFLSLYAHVKFGGFYVVEDCHTSYQEQFGGGIRKPDSFIELAKRKIDELNGLHVQGYHREFNTDFTRTTLGMSFYDSVVVFEKGEVAPIESVQAGS
jgi:cephalosporin hydroxylase